MSMNHHLTKVCVRLHRTSGWTGTGIIYIGQTFRYQSHLSITAYTIQYTHHQSHLSSLSSHSFHRSNHQLLNANSTLPHFEYLLATAPNLSTSNIPLLSSYSPPVLCRSCSRNTAWSYRSRDIVPYNQLN